jgi:hypothetical protein
MTAMGEELHPLGGRSAPPWMLWFSAAGMGYPVDSGAAAAENRGMAMEIVTAGAWPGGPAVPW